MSRTVANGKQKKFPEKQGKADYEVGKSKPPVATRFKKGQSGNPGGQKKGVVYLSEAYKRLMTFTKADLEKYKPANMTEEMAKAQLMRAINAEDKDAINATEKIGDRTEGKPTVRQEIGGLNGEAVLVKEIVIERTAKTK